MESSLYLPVKRFLEKLGFEVKGEICGCDLVALDAGSPTAGSWDGKQPFDMEKELTALEAIGVPLVVGEFSWTQHPEVAYNTRAAIETYDRHHIGFLAWMWNNPGGAATVNMANTMNYTSSSDLTEFGKLLIEDPTVGFKAVAKKATIFP